MQLTLEALCENQDKPEDQQLSIQQIAWNHDVSKDTHSRLAKGGISMTSFNESKQNLSPAQEHILVDYILACADQGFPMTHPQIVTHANSIITSESNKDILPIDLQSNWCDWFLVQHCHEIQTHWSQPLDTKQAQALNLIKKPVMDQNIPPKNLYGMDESSFTPGNEGRQRVAGQRQTKVQHKQGGRDCKNITVIITICADGTALKPAIIYKGKNFMRKWCDNNIANAL
jgi:hypothetical protein